MKHTENEILNSIPLLNQYKIPEIKNILAEYLFGGDKNKKVIDELKRIRFVISSPILYDEYKPTYFYEYKNETLAVYTQTDISNVYIVKKYHNSYRIPSFR
jgi:hypothetical protein